MRFIKMKGLIRRLSFRIERRSEIIKSGFRLSFIPAALVVLISAGAAEAQKSAPVLKLGVVDTGFCPEKTKLPPGVKIHPAFDATGSPDAGENFCDLPNEHPRLHGQKLLEVFLENFAGQKTVEIYPIIVFDRFGRQEISFWENAHRKALALKLDALLTASGFPHLKKPGKYPVWKLPTFAPAGRTGGPITAETLLFPQILAPQKNLILIGNYRFDEFEGGFLIDEKSLFRKRIDYFQTGFSGSATFTGDSRAVAVATGRALALCPADNLRSCLKRNRKPLAAKNAGRKIYTF
jgi:hypothetical protein